jgi:hypothetical protein
VHVIVALARAPVRERPVALERDALQSPAGSVVHGEVCAAVPGRVICQADAEVQATACVTGAAIVPPSFGVLGCLALRPRANIDALRS